MVPRTTRRLTARTATNPANSLVRSSVSRTISLRTTFPHAAIVDVFRQAVKRNSAAAILFPQRQIGLLGRRPRATAKIRTRPGGRPGGSKRSAPASGEKRADGDLKIRHRTLVAATPAKVHWPTAHFTSGVNYFDGILLPQLGQHNSLPSASFFNNDGKINRLGDTAPNPSRCRPRLRFRRPAPGACAKRRGRALPSPTSSSSAAPDRTRRVLAHQPGWPGTLRESG